MLAYALSRLGLSSSKGTSTASRTRVGLRVSTVLFNALVSSWWGMARSELVGVAGFEPTAPRSQSECATKLRHTPGPSASVDGCAPPGRYAGPAARGCSSMAEPQPSKLAMRVRFPSPARPPPQADGVRLRSLGEHVLGGGAVLEPAPPRSPLGSAKSAADRCVPGSAGQPAVVRCRAEPQAAGAGEDGVPVLSGGVVREASSVQTAFRSACSSAVSARPGAVGSRPGSSSGSLPLRRRRQVRNCRTTAALRYASRCSIRCRRQRPCTRARTSCTMSSARYRSPQSMYAVRSNAGPRTATYSSSSVIPIPLSGGSVPGRRVDPHPCTGRAGGQGRSR